MDHQLYLQYSNIFPFYHQFRWADPNCSLHSSDIVPTWRFPKMGDPQVTLGVPIFPILYKSWSFMTTGWFGGALFLGNLHILVGYISWNKPLINCFVGISPLIFIIFPIFSLYSTMGNGQHDTCPVTSTSISVCSTAALILPWQHWSWGWINKTIPSAPDTLCEGVYYIDPKKQLQIQSQKVFGAVGNGNIEVENTGNNPNPDPVIWQENTSIYFDLTWFDITKHWDRS